MLDDVETVLKIKILEEKNRIIKREYILLLKKYKTLLRKYNLEKKLNNYLEMKIGGYDEEISQNKK